MRADVKKNIAFKDGPTSDSIFCAVFVLSRVALKVLTLGYWKLFSHRQSQQYFCWKYSQVYIFFPIASSLQRKC